MKENVGSYDAGVRFVVGCLALYFSLRLGWWALLGLIPILSAAFAFCPIYRLFHINTAKWEDDWEHRHPPGGHHPHHP